MHWQSLIKLAARRCIQTCMLTEINVTLVRLRCSKIMKVKIKSLFVLRRYRGGIKHQVRSCLTWALYEGKGQHHVPTALHPPWSDRDSRVPIGPRWRGVAVQVVWPVPEAAGTVFNTPDNGCCDTRNVVWSGLPSPNQTTLEGSSGTSSMTGTGGCGYSF